MKKILVKQMAIQIIFGGWGGEDNALYQRLKINKIKIDKSKEPVIDIEDKTLDEKFQDLDTNNYKIKLKNERLNKDKKDWNKNGLNNLDNSYEIISKEKQDNISEINVFLKITNDDREEIQEISIKDYKLGMKVSWERYGKYICGIINKIDKSSTKYISVKEHKGNILNIPFYKLTIITDKEYKDCTTKNKEKIEEVVEKVKSKTKTPEKDKSKEDIKENKQEEPKIKEKLDYDQSYTKGYEDGYNNKEYDIKNYDENGYDEGYSEGKNDKEKEEVEKQKSLDRDIKENDEVTWEDNGNTLTGKVEKNICKYIYNML